MHFLAGYAAFLDYRYWINFRPVPLGPSLVGSIVAFFGWFLLAAIVLYFIARHLKHRNRLLLEEVIRRFARLMLVVGFLGYVCLFFAYEQVPLLGMRLWFLLLLVLFIVWLIRAIIFAVRDYPRLHKNELERSRFEKYLPKGK
ncbi:hypothetical protein KKF05_00530 [Patescibacteria group bacterium]|nr:hypothetical protein [Patescibacteria group bacterium]MBU1028706.1 hypothetical protein [Patescibacteria group bacterium]